MCSIKKNQELYPIFITCPEPFDPAGGGAQDRPVEGKETKHEKKGCLADDRPVSQL